MAVDRLVSHGNTSDAQTGECRLVDLRHSGWVRCRADVGGHALRSDSPR